MTDDDAPDRYALWDAAYMLGSLSSTERREYENHLSGCPSCRASVAVMPSSLDARVTLTSQGWGTRVEMACTYEWASEEAAEDADAGDKLAMVAVSRDGNHTQLATWMALSGSTAVTSGSTSMRIDDIVAVQVISADTGDVLLQRNL